LHRSLTPGGGFAPLGELILTKPIAALDIVAYFPFPGRPPPAFRLRHDVHPSGVSLMAGTAAGAVVVALSDRLV